jgi:hypothetical protein
MLDDLQNRPESVASESDPPEVDVPETYHVIVACRDEAEQREVFERLRGEGYACRVSTLS